jgi:hypothetical protein
MNPLVGRSWNELLRLVKLVQVIQQKHQLKEITNDNRTSKSQQQAVEISGGLAQSAAAITPGSDRPTGQAVGETSPGPSRAAKADQTGGEA